MGFNLDNYENVKDRITRFYHDHPDGRILTELVSDADRLDAYAAFKSLVYLGDILKATGYAYESQGQGVNKDAWVENAETSAIGRALANMDYCGSIRPSREEMSKVGNKQESKPEPSKIQQECSDLSVELAITPEQKATMWKASGMNFSNLLIMLRAERDKRKAELTAAWDETERKLKQVDDLISEVK